MNSMFLYQAKELASAVASAEVDVKAEELKLFREKMGLLAIRLLSQGRYSTNPHERLNRRVKILSAIARAKRPDGKMWVGEWGRDCDGTEATSPPRLIEASPRAYGDLYDRIADGAEGPFSLTILTEEEAQAWRVYSRDRALEAFEDGHPWVIYT